MVSVAGGGSGEGRSYEDEGLTEQWLFRYETSCEGFWTGDYVRMPGAAGYSVNRAFVGSSNAFYFRTIPDNRRMETVGFIIGAIFMVVMTIGGIALIWAIIRFSLLGRLKGTRRDRSLADQDPAGMSSVFGISISPSVAARYRMLDDPYAPRVFNGEPGGGAVIAVSQLIPMNPVAVREWRKITGVPGIPIALDYAKGVLYIEDRGQNKQAGGKILYFSPGRKAVEVADGLEEFLIGLREADETDEGVDLVSNRSL